MSQGASFDTNPVGERCHEPLALSPYVENGFQNRKMRFVRFSEQIKVLALVVGAVNAGAFAHKFLVGAPFQFSVGAHTAPVRFFPVAHLVMTLAMMQ
jgi:hypothetical protein